MNNLEMEPVPTPPMSQRKASAIGMAAIGGIFAVSYGAMQLLPLSETPNQERVRACAELLDAPSIDPTTIRLECTYLHELQTTSVIEGKQNLVTTIYPTGNGYIETNMPKAIDSDEHWTPINNNLLRGIGAGGITFAILFGAAIGTIRKQAHAREAA